MSTNSNRFDALAAGFREAVAAKQAECERYVSADPSVASERALLPGNSPLKSASGSFDPQNSFVLDHARYSLPSQQTLVANSHITSQNHATIGAATSYLGRLPPFSTSIPFLQPNHPGNPTLAAGSHPRENLHRPGFNALASSRRKDYGRHPSGSSFRSVADLAKTSQSQRAKTRFDASFVSPPDENNHLLGIMSTQPRPLQQSQKQHQSGQTSGASASGSFLPFYHNYYWYPQQWMSFQRHFRQYQAYPNVQSMKEDGKEPSHAHIPAIPNQNIITKSSLGYAKPLPTNAWPEFQLSLHPQPNEMFVHKKRSSREETPKSGQPSSSNKKRTMSNVDSSPRKKIVLETSSHYKTQDKLPTSLEFLRNELNWGEYHALADLIKLRKSLDASSDDYNDLHYRVKAIKEAMGWTTKAAVNVYDHSISPQVISEAIPKEASSVFYVLDRRINLDAFGNDASFYSLLRAWVQDDPCRYTSPEDHNPFNFSLRVDNSEEGKIDGSKVSSPSAPEKLDLLSVVRDGTANNRANTTKLTKSMLLETNFIHRPKERKQELRKKYGMRKHEAKLRLLYRGIIL